jgi:hypothetical protein
MSTILAKARGLTRSGIVCLIAAFFTVLSGEIFMYFSESLSLVQRILVSFTCFLIAIILVKFAFGGGKT